MVTLTRDAAGCYYVSFCTQVQTELLPATGKITSVDLGLTHLATLPTGEKVKAPKHYHAKLRYLRQQQRALARKSKGSKRYEKQRKRVACAHTHVAAKRDRALHQLTTRLVREHDFVAEQGHWMGRPGSVDVHLEGTPEDVRSVSVGGTAVVVARGTLEVPG